MMHLFSYFFLLQNVHALKNMGFVMNKKVHVLVNLEVLVKSAKVGSSISIKDPDSQLPFYIIYIFTYSQKKKYWNGRPQTGVEYSLGKGMVPAETGGGHRAQEGHRLKGRAVLRPCGKSRKTEPIHVNPPI